mmetsp:Transcript_117648/g.344521  ORF Transcript_117648/g.344521 Transcript_117648/m.344521 type:complete len:270 (+) Transcript_117648:2227-3036(+)
MVRRLERSQACRGMPSSCSPISLAGAPRRPCGTLKRADPAVAMRAATRCRQLRGSSPDASQRNSASRGVESRQVSGSCLSASPQASRPAQHRSTSSTASCVDRGRAASPCPLCRLCGSTSLVSAARTSVRRSSCATALPERWASLGAKSGGPEKSAACSVRSRRATSRTRPARSRAATSFRRSTWKDCRSGPSAKARYRTLHACAWRAEKRTKSSRALIRFSSSSQVKKNAKSRSMGRSARKTNLAFLSAGSTAPTFEMSAWRLSKTCR